MPGEIVARFVGGPWNGQEKLMRREGNVRAPEPVTMSFYEERHNGSYRGWENLDMTPPYSILCYLPVRRIETIDLRTGKFKTHFEYELER